MARQKLEQARRTLSSAIAASPAEFVFTGGGTESNNLALLGMVRHLPGHQKHVITTALEHPSVLEPCRQLEREGVTVTYVRDVRDIERELRPDTVLVSVMHANNETGAVQPIAALAELLRPRRILLHSDGVQALGKIPVNVSDLGVDLYSISAHKLYAPKGVGGLFVRRGVPLRGIQFGGRHERERRAGTENVPGAIAFARAVELSTSSLSPGLRDRFEERLRAAVPDIRINAIDGPRLPNTSNITFPNVSGEGLVIALDTRGMAVSSGSACSSGSTEPSHVLLAMGLSREEARSTVRFSFGQGNTSQDVDALIDAVASSVERLRKRSVKELVYG